MKNVDIPGSPANDAGSDDLLRALVAQPVVPLPDTEQNALRDRVVARMQSRRRAIADGERRAAAWRPWLVFAAAALLPIVVWALVPGRAPVKGQRAGDAVVTEVAGDATVGRDGISTGPGGSARAQLPSGAEVEVESSAQLRFAQAAGDEPRGDRIELAAGEIQVRVPKLARGTDLRVRTANATVIVHGTRFSVQRTAASGETRVAVTEGLVEVDSAEGVHMLSAGMSLVVPTPSAAPALPAAPSPPPPASGVRAPGPAAAAPAQASTLAAENALLAEVMRLRREHQLDRALSKADDFLSRYPSSPLAETARAERQAILDELGGAKSP